MCPVASMEQEKITKVMTKKCGFCDESIKDEYRLRVTFGNDAYIVCHEKCLKRAYDILLLNKI